MRGRGVDVELSAFQCREDTVRRFAIEPDK